MDKKSYLHVVECPLLHLITIVISIIFNQYYCYHYHYITPRSVRELRFNQKCVFPVIWHQICNSAFIQESLNLRNISAVLVHQFFLLLRIALSIQCFS